MKINIKNMGIIIIVVIFAGIWATIAAGIWTTESDKIPATYREGEFEGLYNPEDIRGSYTFKEVSDLFEIELDVLYKAFGLENINNEEFKSKDLEGLYAEAENEIGNGSVQVFVALYKDLPIVLEDTYLPEQAVEIIMENNKDLTEEQLSYLKQLLGMEMPSSNMAIKDFCLEEGLSFSEVKTKLNELSK
ncbi:MAG: hypothetical protein K0Q47_1671 [Sedimentibacter sp.]|nr:hypothetical protein [Sedimentibacter sp.]